MHINKWYSLAAATLLQFAAGLVYTFSLFAPSLKSSLGYSQVQLEGVGSAVLSGGYLAWIPGLTYDALLRKHNKLAPRLAAGVGCFLLAAGYLGIWAAATHRVVLPYWFVLVCGVASSSGIVWLDAGCMITSCHNFSAHQGSVAGILKAYLGLSASVATSIYIAVFKPNELSFLLFVAMAPLGIGLVTIPFLNYVPHSQAVESPFPTITPGRRLNLASGVLVVLIIYQGASVLIDTHYHVHRHISYLLMLGALALAGSASLMLSFGVGGFRSKPVATPHGSQDVETDSSPDLAEERKLPDALQEHLLPQEVQRAGGPNSNISAADAAANPSLSQCLLSLDYWLHSSSFFIVMGAGFTLLNNMGQIVQSLGGKSAEVHVLSFTTMNCLGRLACGSFSEFALHRYGVLRTVFPIYLAAGTSLVCFAVAFAPYQLLLPLAALGGFVFGGQWPMMPALTTEVFGAEHFCANQSVPQAATALGALLLANQLAGRLYQWHVPPAEKACYGRYCFRMTFIIIGFLAALQVAVSWLFWSRTRRRFLCNVRAYLAAS